MVKRALGKDITRERIKIISQFSAICRRLKVTVMQSSGFLPRLIYSDAQTFLCDDLQGHETA